MTKQELIGLLVFFGLTLAVYGMHKQVELEDRENRGVESTCFGLRRKAKHNKR